MALTAMAQSALPSWDDTIVPALRKRLETESRILAKRMSIASVSSLERSSAPSHSPRSSRDISSPPQTISEPRKSSAIPRPSLQYSRSPPDPSPRVNGTLPSPSFPSKRPRTYSQPPSPNAITNNPLPTPDSSRPTSPRTSDVKPTRIPVAARARTTSSSSHVHSIAQRTESRNGSHHRPYQPPTPDTSQDNRVVKASEPLQPTTPPMASIRHKASNIMNEPPPFTTPSVTSSIRSRIQDPIHLDPRPSNDSEERPFEHWYRGDVHRNGGVGELRVAKHVEMLQIANYGHNLRKAARRQARDVSGQVDSATPLRRRADSVDAGTHESLHLDDAPTKDVDMVFDESPLTDIEADPDSDPETFYDAYAGVDTQVITDGTIHARVTTSTSGPPPAAVSTSRSQTPTSARPVLNGHTTPKRMTHTHATSDSLQSSTSSVLARMSTESTVPTPGSVARMVPRTTSPTSQSSDQSHSKRRAKSPAASSPASTPKKARIKVRTPPSASRRDDPRSSIATYPTPEGDMVDAIPTWTQPVPKAGNWDEVVLPVVARKKGLDGQYEHADGSPKPKPQFPPIKPAPGTFGYDYTKYRPPRVEEIQLHEFGQLPESAPIPEEEDLVPPLAETSLEPISQIIQLDEPKLEDPRQTVPKPPDSPAPFSRYHIQHQVPTINVTRPSTEMVEHRQEQEYDDASVGCCRCVVM